MTESLPGANVRGEEDEATPSHRSRLSRPVAAGALVFLLALLVRIANFQSAFVNGVPQFPPFDDLYHAKRIAYSATHLFRVLEFDPNRGIRGALCPWPPLYDMFAGAVARAFGGTTPVSALARAAWFPPIVAALVAAAIAAWMTRRFGFIVGLVGGAGIALSISFVDKSRLGTIDHHFLEFPLTLGIIAATAALISARETRSAVRCGGVFAISVSCALFVQPALLLAAGVALVSVLLLDRRERVPRAAAGIGFALASALVFVYRAVQPDGYPDNEWYLGVPHAAALLGAAAACAAALLLIEQGWSRTGALAVALGIGILTIAAVPGALEAVFGGSRFLGGDTWFRSIAEFQPLLFRHESVWWLDLCLLGGGALITVPMLATARWRKGSRRLYLLFAVGYLAAALSSMRFLAIAAPLLAVSGAAVFADVEQSGRKSRAWVVAAFLLVPSLVLAVGRVTEPAPAIGPEGIPAVRAAEAVARVPLRPGRVLSPWSWGHLFNVIADRGVLLDNFGTMSGETEFANATGITLATREGMVADYCAAHGVRFIVLEDPLPYYAAHAEMSGLSRRAFERPPGDARSEPSPTKLMKATFWWRAYFEGGRERPAAGPAGAAFQDFRLVAVFSEPQPSERRSTVQVWEFRPEGGAPVLRSEKKTIPIARDRHGREGRESEV